MAVTIYDIANKLNISVATVNRAFSGSGRISQKTKELVLKTADEMGYKANRAAQSLRRSPIHIGVLLCCPAQSYLEEIERGIKAGFQNLEQYNVFPHIRTVVGYNASDKEKDVSDILASFESEGYSGIIIFLSGDCAPFKEQLCRIAENIPIASVANDPGCGRIVSVSADGACAGSLAAEILGLCAESPKTAVLTGSRRTDIHAANLKGFAAYSAANGFSGYDIYEHYDNQDKLKKEIDTVIRKGGYNGVYITSSVTLPESYALKLQKNGLKVVATDLSKENRALLRARLITAVIFQDPFLQGKTVVKRLYDYITGGTASDELLLPSLIFSSDAGKFLK